MPGARCGGRWRCWATSALGDGSSTRSPCSTASTRRGGTSSGRCSRSPTHRGTSATPTSSDRRERTPSRRRCTSRPSCRRRVPTPCATPHPRKASGSASTSLRRPRSRHMVGGTKPDRDALAPRLSASMVLRRKPFDRAGLARLLWAYPLMTTRVSSGIYAEAVRLAARGAPFHRHPARGDVASDAHRRRDGAQRARDLQMSRTSASLLLELGSPHRPAPTWHLALRGWRGTRAETCRNRVR